ncbi:MAG: 7-carboxy-7-deazaguanine synthase QueE [Gammaproteobacteria bacterium TMED78]|nr:MAG: 7-carboxy-7-deazaguanine synthase QueE [Gammaproteobacteria bacterium TMED78]
MSSKKIKISEIFYSIQGEAIFTGIPTIFIRLSGCPLRCKYCDTEYAFTGGNYLEVAQIMNRISKINSSFVCVTGGEPLAQKSCSLLLDALCKKKYSVSLETSGAFNIKNINPDVIKILDIKTPSSGESDKNLLENLSYLTNKDCLKIVICNRKDYEWAKDLVATYKSIDCEIYFSPSHNELPSTDLSKWILDDSLPVRLQLQVHKYIWGDKRGH